MKPGRYDFAITRGNNQPVTFRFKTTADGAEQPLDLSYSVLVLTVSSRQGTLRKSSDDADGLAVEPLAGVVTWYPTTSETRTIPEGRLSTYEIEWRQADGRQLTLLLGAITGVGGLADD